MLAIITETFKQRVTMKNKFVAYTKRDDYSRGRLKHFSRGRL